MANEGVNKAILKWEVDKRSVNDVIKSIDSVIKRGEKLQDGLFDAWQTGRRAADEAKKSFRSTITDIEGNAKTIKQLRDEFLKTSNAAKQAGQSGRGGFSLGAADSLFTRGGRSLSGLGAGAVGEPLQAVGDFFQLLDTGSQAAEMAAQSIGSVTKGFATLAIGGGALALAYAAITLAQQKYNDELKKGEEAIEKAIADKERYYTAVYTMDSEQAKQTIEDAKVQKRIYNDIAGDIRAEINRQAAEIAKTNGIFASLTPEQQEENLRRRDEFKKLFEELDNADAKFNEASATVNQFTIALEKNAFAVNDAKKAALEKAQTDKMLFDLIRQQQAKEMAEQEAANKRKADAEQKRIDDSINILKRRDDAIATLESQAADQRIELQQRNLERINQITQQAIEANEATYAKLLDRQAELNLDSLRTEEAEQRRADFESLQEQIDFNRDEQKALVDHQRKIRDIERSFLSEQRDALLDRNFLELFRLQENKKEQLAEEEEANEEAKAERQEALRDQQQDTARQRIFERNERRIALQNALNDARDGYIKELMLQQQATTKAIQLANQGYQTELAQLNNKVQIERSIKEQAAINELNLVNQTEAQKHQIFLRYFYEVQRLLGQPFTPYQNPNVEGTLGGSVGNTQGGRSNFFAGGGFARAGIPFIANEPWSSGAEKFGGVKLPGGMGVTFPFKSGYVDPGKSGGFTLMQNITVQGTNNPEMTARAVVRISREQAWQVQKEVAN